VILETLFQEFIDDLKIPYRAIKYYLIGLFASIKLIFTDFYLTLFFILLISFLFYFNEHLAQRTIDSLLCYILIFICLIIIHTLNELRQEWNDDFYLGVEDPSENPYHFIYYEHILVKTKTEPFKEYKGFNLIYIISTLFNRFIEYLLYLDELSKFLALNYVILKVVIYETIYGYRAQKKYSEITLLIDHPYLGWLIITIGALFKRGVLKFCGIISLIIYLITFYSKIYTWTIIEYADADINYRLGLLVDDYVPVESMWFITFVILYMALILYFEVRNAGYHADAIYAILFLSSFAGFLIHENFFFVLESAYWYCDYHIEFSIFTYKYLKYFLREAFKNYLIKKDSNSLFLQWFLQQDYRINFNTEDYFGDAAASVVADTLKYKSMYKETSNWGESLEAYIDSLEVKREMGFSIQTDMISPGFDSVLDVPDWNTHLSGVLNNYKRNQINVTVLALKRNFGIGRNRPWQKDPFPFEPDTFKFRIKKSLWNRFYFNCCGWHTEYLNHFDEALFRDTPLKGSEKYLIKDNIRFFFWSDADQPINLNWDNPGFYSKRWKKHIIYNWVMTWEVYDFLWNNLVPLKYKEYDDFKNGQ